MEHPAYGTGFGKVAAILAHEMAKFADDTIAIGGDGLNEHAYPARTVSFEGHFFILFAFELAGAAEQSTLNVVIGHVLVFGGEDGGAQAGIGIDIATAEARGDGNFTDDAGEDATALGVGGGFFVLDGGPL
jgi:hypothetical protein